MPVWHEEIKVGEWLNKYPESEINDWTDEGYEKFLEIRKGVADELRTCSAWVSEEGIAKMPRGAPGRGQALVLRNLVQWVEESETIAQFKDTMHLVYAWGDRQRVWMGS